MANEPGTSERTQGELGILTAEAAAAARTLRDRYDRASQRESFWRELESLYRSGHVCHILAHLATQRDLANAVRSEGGEPSELLERVSEECAALAHTLMRRFAQHFEQAARPALPIDSGSRHPRYTFERGFFTVVIDERARGASISDYEGPLTSLPADPVPIMEALLRERDRVFGRAFDAKKVIDLLWSNYRAVVGKESEPDGGSVPIRQITRRLTKKGTRSDEFAVDLARLAVQGPMVIGGWKLELQHTREHSRGILLHGLEQRGYVGYVVFRKVTDDM